MQALVSLIALGYVIYEGTYARCNNRRNTMERLKAYENKYDWDSWNTGKITHQEPSEIKKVYRDYEWRGS